MRTWDKFFDEKIREIAKAKYILDIGSGERFKGLSKYKKYFDGTRYVTVDQREKCKPDIIADIHAIPLPDLSVDAIICKSVLQFAHDPFRAVHEMFRVLKPQGTCFLYLPFLYPYHGGPRDSMRDYWRFSVDGISELFCEFQKIETCPVKRQFETAATILPFQNTIFAKSVVFAARLLDLITEKFQSGKQVSGYFIYLVK